MTPDPLVSNANPLIALNQIDCLTLLPRLYASVIIPLAVALSRSGWRWSEHWASLYSPSDAG